ncbi:hypothetical protein [Priestia filamentosa]|uniref:hypothetical protein n=1 Tax=Priestia filamentosa TaxID=1402861 RepID=UPI0023499991|nr:hypothetical protein [Priestia filamentosa]WCM16512.1 hypothetical protein PGN40_03950 [Priestia filamentosa]
MSKKTTSSSNQSIQLQQKLIHYKSEINRLEHTIKKYEQDLETERANVAFWKKKYIPPIHSLDDGQTEVLKKEISLLKNELSEQKMINERLQAERILSSPKATLTTLKCYFMYSSIIPSGEEEDVTLIGNAVIKNETEDTVHAPLLCLKVSEPKCIISGKIRDSSHKEEPSLSEQNSEGWEYAVKDWKERVQKNGEYWLKPLKTHEIPPGESVTFDSFQLTLSSSLSSFILEGYAYTTEFKEGVPFLNKAIFNFSS